MGEKKERAAKDKTADDFMDWSKFPEITREPKNPKEEEALAWMKSLHMPQDLEKLSPAFTKLYISRSLIRLSYIPKGPDGWGDSSRLVELGKDHMRLSIESGGYASMSDLEKHALNLIRR